MKPNHHAQSGSSLLLVLAVMFILGTTLAGLLAGLNTYIDRQSSRYAGLRAYHMALSGLAFAMEPEIDRDADILNRDINELEGYQATFTSENSRLNINALVLGNDRGPLERLFLEWGLDPVETDTLVDRLIDWVDPDSLKRLNGAEELDYLAINRTGQPRNGSFKSLEEMEQVLGMERLTEVRPDWKDYFTVHVNTQLNLTDADPQVIAAFLDLPLAQVEAFTDYRKGIDRIENTGDEPELSNIGEVLSIMGASLNLPAETLSKIGLNSTHRRIVSVGRAGEKQYRIEVITAITGNTNRNNIVWLEL